jgi:hypothetical protein
MLLSNQSRNFHNENSFELFYHTRFWFGVYPLLSDDVLFPASPLLAVHTRAGGETVPISSGGAQNQSA